MLLGEARLALFGTPWAPLLTEPVRSNLLPPAKDFRDEAGHSRAIDPLVIAWLTKDPALPIASRPSIDIRLWQMLLRGEPGEMIEFAGNGSKPLVTDHEALTLEVWTETELASLHAISHAGSEARNRVNAAADWIVENLQPDNATNHPWAVHVFLKRAFEADMPEHRLYAESLLHNCVVGLGRPDRFSALILIDAARTLLANG